MSCYTICTYMLLPEFVFWIRIEVNFPLIAQCLILLKSLFKPLKCPGLGTIIKMIRTKGRSTLLSDQGRAINNLLVLVSPTAESSTNRVIIKCYIITNSHIFGSSVKGVLSAIITHCVPNNLTNFCTSGTVVLSKLR